MKLEQDESVQFNISSLDAVKVDGRGDVSFGVASLFGRPQSFSGERLYGPYGQDVSFYIKAKEAVIYQVIDTSNGLIDLDSTILC